MNDIYYLLPKKKWLMTIGFILLILAFFGIREYFFARHGALLCGSILALVAAVEFWHSINIRLFVFEDEIQYRNGGHTVCAKWIELTEIQEKQYFCFLRFSGIFVSIPSKNEIPIPLLTRWISSLNSPVQTHQSVFIPLSIFVNDWQNSDLGQQIKQYAPHLFQ